MVEAKHEFVDDNPYLVYTSQDTIVYSDKPNTSIDDISGSSANNEMVEAKHGFIDDYPYLVYASQDTIVESDKANTSIYDISGSSAKTVTISLTNPQNPDRFHGCTIFQSDSSSYEPAQEERIGSIESPTGSATVAVSMPYLRIYYDGTSVLLGTVTCTGDVSFVTTYDGGIEVYQVAGDGTIVSDGVNYDD